MEAAVQQYSVDKQCFEIQKKHFLIENNQHLDQIISQDIVNIVVNSSLDINTSVKVNYSIAMNGSVNNMEMCNKCLELEAELIKQHNMTYKQLYDSIKPLRVQAKEHVESLVNPLNQKSVEITDLNAQLQDKLNPVTLAPKDKNNRKTHIYYLKHTIEQATILREIVEQAKSLNPLDSASYSPLRVSLSTKSSRSKSTDNTKNDRILQISSRTQKKNKVEDHSRII
ncbi:hypothetical protein Tco_1446419, partial [Tanacetum coccineum]